MRRRGRKSADELATMIAFTAPERPLPPPELTPEQGEVFREIVGCLPGAFFKMSYIQCIGVVRKEAFE